MLVFHFDKQEMKDSDLASKLKDYKCKNIKQARIEFAFQDNQFTDFACTHIGKLFKQVAAKKQASTIVQQVNFSGNQFCGNFYNFLFLICRKFCQIVGTCWFAANNKGIKFGLQSYQGHALLGETCHNNEQIIGTLGFEQEWFVWGS